MKKEIASLLQMHTKYLKMVQILSKTYINFTTYQTPHRFYSNIRRLIAPLIVHPIRSPNSQVVKYLATTSVCWVARASNSYQSSECVGLDRPERASDTVNKSIKNN